jgi:hypothetical protein
MTNMLLNIMFVYLLWTGALMAILYGLLFGSRAAASYAVENGLARAKQNTLVCAFLGASDMARLAYRSLAEWVNEGAPAPQVTRVQG